MRFASSTSCGAVWPYQRPRPSQWTLFTRAALLTTNTGPYPIVVALDVAAEDRRAVFGDIDDKVVATGTVQVLEYTREQSRRSGGF
jgi:hypothetical protein